MKMAQEINTQRALTIAGSVALLALSAYGVWKWNQTGNTLQNDKGARGKIYIMCV